MAAAQDPLDRLPELPPELLKSIGSLKRSDYGPFLTNEPRRIEVPGSLPPVAAPVRKVSHMTRRHFAWATYPVVVCHEPGDLMDGLKIATARSAARGPRDPEDELRQLAGRVEHYRLSALEGRTFPRPLWCTVRHGPWYGRFKEEESCIAGDSVHKWDFYLEGVQAPEVLTTWFGSISDMPSVPSLDVIWGTLQSENPVWSAC
jgi:hypothetical protein